MNALRTTLLMTVMMLLFMTIGQYLGGQTGMMIAFVIAVAMNFSGYWFSDKVVLKMYNGQEVERSQAPDLYDMVDRLRQKADLPMPKVYVIPDDRSNAFATGRNPKNAAVAVTNGIVKRLNNDELEGVIAHELAHIKNRDILTSAVAATMASGITMLVQFFGFFGGRNREGGMIGTLAMFILAPMAAGIVQMAISRTREYSADRDGAAISGKPEALASALRKLHEGAERQPMHGNQATAHMFIVNPFAGGLRGLFSTHPPAEERIERLMQLARQ